MKRGMSVLACVGAFAAALLAGCTPRVEVALPEKPIEININAKIQHEVRVKIERDVADLVTKEKDLF